MEAEERVAVEQVDRDAAAKLYEWFPRISSTREEGLKTAAFIRAGGGDGWNTVQVFAKHRTTATPCRPAPTSNGLADADVEIDRILAMSNEEIMAEATPLDLAEVERMRGGIQRMLRVGAAAYERGQKEAAAEARRAALSEAAEAARVLQRYFAEDVTKRGQSQAHACTMVLDAIEEMAALTPPADEVRNGR